MESATPKIMLERIREEWPDVEDAIIYKELESERHLWMLTAIKYLSKKSRNSSGATSRREETAPAKNGSSRVSKVLSLYENQGKPDR
jgi:hypothetical protein